MRQKNNVFLVFLIVLLSLTLVNRVFATEIFSDGFESGDLSEWTSSVGSPTVASDPTHHGDYSLNSTIETGAHYVYKTFGSSYSTLVSRFYWRIETALSTWQYLQIHAHCFGGTKLGEVIYRRESGNPMIRVTNHHTSTNYDVEWTATVSTWTCFELKVIRHATDGEIHFRINDVEIINETELDTGDTDLNTIWLGKIWDAAGGKETYIDCVVVADVYIGMEAEGEEKSFYGTISQQFAVTSTRTWSFNRYSLTNPTFTINHKKTWAFNLFPTVNPQFTITGAAEFITGQIKNFFGSIGQLFTVNHQKSWSFSRYSTLNPVFTVQSVLDYIQTRNFYGAIAQLFSVSSQRTWLFTRFSNVNPQFTIDSLTQFAQPGVLNFYGSINAVIRIVGYTPLAGEGGSVLAAFLLVALCLVLTIPLGLLIIRRRR